MLKLNTKTSGFMVFLTLAIGYLAPSAEAACPDIRRIGNETEIIGSVYIPGKFSHSIYFCKQEFDQSALQLAVSEESLVDGGSQAISMGSTIQKFPLASSVNLAGFTPNPLSLNDFNLSADFPNKNGYGGYPSLFNFYTVILGGADCKDAYLGGNQYEFIKNYLKENPYIFQVTNQNKAGVVDSESPLSIVKIKDVKLFDELNSNEALVADISFYHVTANQSPYFMGPLNLTKYCWFGVGAKMDIKQNNINSSGSYKVNVGVLTQ